jgi:hypothetical protein
VRPARDTQGERLADGLEDALGRERLDDEVLGTSLIDSSSLDSWPSAEHMTTRADGSSSMISRRAVRPSFWAS